VLEHNAYYHHQHRLSVNHEPGHNVALVVTKTSQTSTWTRQLQYRLSMRTVRPLKESATWDGIRNAGQNLP